MDEADVRVRIRHLRIDPALAKGLSAGELQEAVRQAVAERLGPGLVQAPQPFSVSGSIADAVAGRVRPALGKAGG